MGVSLRVTGPGTGPGPGPGTGIQCLVAGLALLAKRVSVSRAAILHKEAVAQMHGQDPSQFTPEPPGHWAQPGPSPDWPGKRDKKRKAK